MVQLNMWILQKPICLFTTYVVYATPEVPGFGTGSWYRNWWNEFEEYEKNGFWNRNRFSPSHDSPSSATGMKDGTYDHLDLALGGQDATGV